MNFDYDEYESECKRIRGENAKLLEEFAEWLSARGLSGKTASIHCDNIKFYLNHFLVYEEAQDAASGVSQAEMFLGFWFIRKAMWASKSSIKSNAASLKKFYAFMLENGKVSKEDYAGLKEEIKLGMPEWLKKVRW